jgi:hypothetical protein
MSVDLRVLLLIESVNRRLLRVVRHLLGLWWVLSNVLLGMRVEVRAVRVAVVLTVTSSTCTWIRMRLRSARSRILRPGQRSLRLVLMTPGPEKRLHLKLEEKRAANRASAVSLCRGEERNVSSIDGCRISPTGNGQQNTGLKGG